LPARPFHAILSTLGTDGDVFPYIGLGTLLRSRGHRVTLIASGNYLRRATEHDLEFIPLVEASEADALFSRADFWHPVKGGLIGARWGAPHIPRQYEMFAELARDPDSVFICSPAIFAGRLVQEKFNRPLATVVLQPWMIPSLDAPPVFPPRVGPPRWAPRALFQLHFGLIHGIGWLLIGRALNKLRRKVGLPPVWRVFRWWFSPELMIGMFPDWWGQPQADWPSQMRLAGFPMFDGVGDEQLPPDLIEFLDAGDPPIVFTFGTGMMHASHLYSASLEACRSLGKRAIFATKYAEQLPQPLPPFARQVCFAPFMKLFPRCAAVVHHGGIGTIAKCLAAGPPQLVLPVAYDQFENAMKVKALGAGDWLPPRRRNAADIAKSLRELLSGQTATAGISISSRFCAADGLDQAADMIERLASTSLPRTPVA
jgi:rhamnosyltransferase subunit B